MSLTWEDADWADGAKLADWLERAFPPEHLNLDRVRKIVREGREQDRTVSFYTVDALCCEVAKCHVSIVPDEVWTDDPPQKGTAGAQYEKAKPLASKKWLKREMSTGKSYPQIGRELGITPRTVQNWAERHGLARGKGWSSARSPAQLALGPNLRIVQRYLDSGHTIADVARLYGLSHQAASRFLKDNGVRYVVMDRRKVGPEGWCDQGHPRAFYENESRWRCPTCNNARNRVRA